MDISVSERGCSIIFLKGFTVIACPAKAVSICDVRDGSVRIQQGVQAFPQAEFRHIGNGRFPQIFFKQQGTAAFATGTGSGNMVEGNPFPHMFFHIGHHISEGGQFRGFFFGKAVLCAQVIRLDIHNGKECGDYMKTGIPGVPGSPGASFRGQDTHKDRHSFRRQVAHNFDKTSHLPVTVPERG